MGRDWWLLVAVTDVSQVERNWLRAAGGILRVLEWDSALGAAVADYLWTGSSPSKGTV
jgi:hypothetical protein